MGNCSTRPIAAGMQGPTADSAVAAAQAYSRQNLDGAPVRDGAEYGLPGQFVVPQRASSATAGATAKAPAPGLAVLVVAQRKDRKWTAAFAYHCSG
ncbi:hypothetical protein [Motilibacter deserti]|uniref:Lipoprotein n=1 Tax=Motilibacter deserti TaxID=2714956 RepID=A0ABX0H2V1_9ACTN|nr:hypothetical protein [Motilibacter deserti]NHC16374.1 hypothetical protein [Motilibacter deserti]